MTDPWETKVDSAPPRQGINPAMIAAIATSVAVLAIIGATGGYLLASADPKSTPSASVTSPAAGPSTADSPSPDASPSAEVSAAPSASAGSPAPVVDAPLPPGAGQDFRAYFTQLRGLKLGVVAYFDESASGGQVTRTDPPAGTLVHNGVTVKVYVAGPPIVTDVPNLAGSPCGSIHGPLYDNGLTVKYATGKTGQVVRQDPQPGTGTAHWNDEVTVYCAVARR
ncbi:PASTA domain-containing protein [Hamadaea tsunoensis]|uniref:PASTA domain-containing protein n=1 Tax=Hamadaea tsunoensis TaxID=53368 RepID=UPI0004031F6C|nr:PASTA domain-containing protein [Hamadaea tsunoensis]